MKGKHTGILIFLVCAVFLAFRQLFHNDRIRRCEALEPGVTLDDLIAELGSPHRSAHSRYAEKDL